MRSRVQRLFVLAAALGTVFASATIATAGVRGGGEDSKGSIHVGGDSSSTNRKELELQLIHQNAETLFHFLERHIGQSVHPNTHNVAEIKEQLRTFVSEIASLYHGTQNPFHDFGKKTNWL